VRQALELYGLRLFQPDPSDEGVPREMNAMHEKPEAPEVLLTRPHAKKAELSALSPTGTHGFHKRMTFGRLYVRQRIPHHHEVGNHGTVMPRQHTRSEQLEGE